MTCGDSAELAFRPLARENSEDFLRMAPDWLVDRIVRWRVALLLLAVLLAAGAWLLTPRLKFDRSVEKMFPADSPVLASYQKLKRTFGGNEIVLAVYQDPELFAGDGVGIRRVADVARRLGQAYRV